MWLVILLGVLVRLAVVTSIGLEDRHVFSTVSRVDVLDIPQASFDDFTQSVTSVITPLLASSFGSSPLSGEPTGSGGATSAKATNGDSYGGEGLTFQPVRGPAHSTVILLHGMATKATDIALVATIAQQSGFESTRFIFPQAPVAPVDYLQKSVESWFNMGGTRPGDLEYPDEILAAVERIEKIVHGEYQKGIPTRKVAVVGMSQGGAVVLTLFMRAMQPLGGAIGISTWLPLMDSYPKSQSTANRKLDLLMIHGSDDDVIDLSLARASARRVQMSGRNVTLDVLQGVGHLLGNDIFKATAYSLQYLKTHAIH